MRKTILWLSCAVVFSMASSFMSHDNGTKKKEMPKSCTVNHTFTNNSLTYTIPLTTITDVSSTTPYFNVAPGGTVVGGAFTYTTGNLDFEVSFQSPNPGGVLRLYENGVLVQCLVVPRNSNLIWVLTDTTPTCNANYDVVYSPGLSC